MDAHAQTAPYEPPYLDTDGICINCTDHGCPGCAGDYPTRDRALRPVLAASDAQGIASERPLREPERDAAVRSVVAGARHVITFEALGTPAPKGSARAMLIGGRARVIASGSSANQGKIKSWDVAIRDAARRAIGPVDAPPFVRVPLLFSVTFGLARPGGHYSKATGKLLPSAPKYPIAKPDGDKLARQAADSLAGIVFDDDSRIVSWRIDKIYATPGNEGALFAITVAP